MLTQVTITSSIRRAVACLRVKYGRAAAFIGPILPSVSFWVNSTLVGAAVLASACSGPTLTGPTGDAPLIPVTVRVRTFQTDLPILLAQVAVRLDEPAQVHMARLTSYTDANGEAVVDVPLNTRVTITASAPDRRSFSAGGVVLASGERWTFYLEPVQ